MTKTSTPDFAISSVAPGKRPSAQCGPKRLTLERIRQVARSYTCIPSSLPGMGLVLN